MVNFLSIVIGLVALLLAAAGFLPLLGWLNWIVVPISVVGAAIGLLSDNSAGRNINFLVMIIGLVRLGLGGGVM